MVVKHDAMVIESLPPPACIAIVNGINMRFEALTAGKAVIRCAPPDDMSEEFGNIYFCNSHNITFSGIVFEECGLESNVFFTTSTDISFEDCTFR